MKIIVCLLVMIICGVLGYRQKFQIKRELDLFAYLDEYAKFCLNNISLFKNNLVLITDNYLIMHKNKNAKYNDIFKKNGGIYQISSEILSKYITSKSDFGVVYSFLNDVGSNDYEFEKNRIENFIKFLSERTAIRKELLKTKADLRFKLFLSLGAVISIIIW